MKRILPAVICLPSILITAAALVGGLTNRPVFQALGLPAVLLILPLVCFVTCVALAVVFPNAREWKLAAVISGVPVLFVVLVTSLFALLGYHG